MNCVNPNSPEFKELLKVANINTHILAAKVSVWQDNNGVDNFPNINDVLKPEEINFTLKAVDILQSDKAKQVFEKGKKSNWDLNKILTELQVPKEQKQLLLDLYNNMTVYEDKVLPLREQLALELASKYSYSVEIDTSKSSSITQESSYDYLDEYEGFPPDEITSDKDLINSNYYSNLTVPGGTNYTEEEISTPLITPSIKGHAQFATDNGIGWFRSDEAMDKPLSFDMYENGVLKGLTTRRILEVQSDLFQKGRDKEDLINKTDKNKLIEFLKNEEKYLQQLKNELEEIKKLKENDLIEGKLANIKQQENIVRINKQNIDNFERFKLLPDNQFLQLLNKDSNWVTFFVKSIIQDSAKKGYEKVLFPTGNTSVKIESPGTEIKTINEAKERGQTALANTGLFYENTVTNILNKTYGKENVKLITDEYGNTWNEITIEEKRDSKTILANKSVNENLGNHNQIKISELYPKAKTSLDYIKAIIKKTKNKTGLAKHLEKYVAANNINVVLYNSEQKQTFIDKYKGERKFTPQAVFDKNTNSIHILDDGSYPVDKYDQLILHEILHSISAYELLKSTQLTKEFQKFFNHAEKYLLLYKEDGVTFENYGMLDTDEFLVALFTDKEFIKRLKDIPALNTNYKNLFVELIDKFLKIIGITKKDSFYEQAFSIATNIIDENYQRQQARKDNIQEEENDSKIIPTSRKQKELDLGIGIPAGTISNTLVANIREKIIKFNNDNISNNVRYELPNPLYRDQLPESEQKGKSPLYQKISVIKYVGASKTAQIRMNKNNNNDNNQLGLFDNPASPQIQELTPERTEAIKSLFNENPELKEIFNNDKNLYSEYLDSIFPDSKVKDIVYHGTNNVFDVFDDTIRRGFYDFKGSKAGIFVNTNSENVKYWGSNTIALLINTTNPNAVSFEDFKNGLFPKNADLIYPTFDINNPKPIEKILLLDTDLAVLKDTQTYILGNKQDIKNAKKFVNKKNNKFDDDISTISNNNKPCK